MSENRTRRIERPGAGEGPAAFFARYRAALVLLSGAAAGSEVALEAPRLFIGRGPGADLTFDDPAMSRVHAALELADQGYRVRDLGSTNGVRLNGSPVETAELKHGDRLLLGESTFQFILEEREASPRTYILPED